MTARVSAADEEAGRGPFLDPWNTACSGSPVRQIRSTKETRIMCNRCLSSAFAKIRMALAVAALVTGTGAVLAAEIIVGQVGPLSGPEAGQGRAYAAGMQLHFTA